MVLALVLIPRAGWLKAPPGITDADPEMPARTARLSAIASALGITVLKVAAFVA